MKRITNKIDKLAALRAQINELKKAEEKLVGEVKDQGIGKYAGTEHVATVFAVDRETVDWKGIAERVGFSPQMLAAYTTKSTTVQLRLSAMPAQQAKAA